MKHVHLNELPGWMARKGSDTETYATEVIQTIASNNFTHNKVMISANHARFLVKQITTNDGIQPENEDVLKAVQDFAYHYENYMLRAYILREKVLLFINAGLKIGFHPNEVTMKMIRINPTVKEAGIISVLDKFDSSKGGSLGQLVQERNILTHRLSYGAQDRLLRPESEEMEDDFRGWCKKWAKNISTQAKRVDKAEYQVADLHHGLAQKTLSYREKIRQK